MTAPIRRPRAASRGGASQGRASQGGASQGRASQGRASLGRASQGRASLGRASQGRASLGRASQGGAPGGGAPRGAPQGPASRDGASRGDAPRDGAPGGGGRRGGRGRRADPVRRVAYDVLIAVDQRDAYANLLLPSMLAERGLEGRDAALATELTYGTLRGRGSYDAILGLCSDRRLDRVDPPLREVLRLGTHQLLATRVRPH